MAKDKKEPITEESKRMWASASFVGVLIIIGLPLWWKTTEVYRVALPYSKISEFDTESHFITTYLTVLANTEQAASEVAASIEKAFQDYDVINLKIKTEVIPEKLQRTLDSVADEQEAMEEVALLYETEEHNTFFVVQRKQLFQEVWVSGQRISFFRDTKGISTITKALIGWIYQPSVLNGARSETADDARQMRFPGGSGYHIVLSVVHPKPQSMKVDFQAGEAMEDYIGSFVDELTDLYNITLKSQWLHLLDFDFQAKEVNDRDGRHHVARLERMPLLLTRLEERAATHVSEKPAINLALYAVPCALAPLLIHQETPIISPVQAFMSPKWGGVVLGSPTAEECASAGPTYRPPVNLVMGTFVSQLRKLLGITDKAPVSGGHLESLRSVVPRLWEVDALLRIRTLEYITFAERSLKSLAKLLGEISNIVINDEVATSINSAVTLIGDSRRLMAEGKLMEAHETARGAFLAAETAFMEPSLLALLYFPDDQKYAIYIPLFLPIMFPVILSLKNLLLWIRGKPVMKEKAD